MKDELKDKVNCAFKVGGVIGEKSSLGKIVHTDNWKPGAVVKDTESRSVSDNTEDDNVKDSKEITTQSVGDGNEGKN